MKSDALELFRLRSSEAEALADAFSLLLTEVRLDDLSRSDIGERVPDASGCYLWLLRLGNARYKIYLGKTKNIRRRVTDYTLDFQIQSPNDFKLRFFQEYVDSVWSDAALDLYVTPVEPSRLNQRETELVRSYAPLINQRLRPTEVERARVRSAVAAYYRSVFERKLRVE